MESTVSCAFTECTEETYLPHTCSQCNKKFCSKHESQESHKCPFEKVSKLRTTVCPMCNEVLRVEAGESLDHAVNTHLDTGKCSSNNRHKNNVPRQQNAASFLFGGGGDTNSSSSSSSASKNNFCSLQDCSQYEPVPVVCFHCHKNFCLKHKLPEQHNCSKLATISKSAAAAQQQQRTQIVNGQVLSTTSTEAAMNQRKIDEVLFTCSNSAETAIGIRPGRNITQGDILVMCLYDAGRLKRPNLKPVLFSVSPLTPIGRLLDAAIDHYPALPKTAKYTIFSSVGVSQGKMAANSTKRHQILNQGMNLGDVFAEAAATGTAFPPGSMDKFYSPVDNRVILAFCISVEDTNNTKSPTSSQPPGTTNQQQQQQQQDLIADQHNSSGMVRSETDKVLLSAMTMNNNNNNNQLPPPLETQACWVRTFKDSKGTILPILVDKDKVSSSASGSVKNKNSSGSGGKKKDGDTCLVQ